MWEKGRDHVRRSFDASVDLKILSKLDEGIWNHALN